jgi:GxxExxY protein
MEFDMLSNRVIGCAVEVHRHLGPGLLESAYEECLAYELKLSGIAFQRQAELPVTYKGLRLDCCYRMDLVVENALLLEIKSVELLLPIHEAQLLTYLKLSGIGTGLLMNFNERYLKDGLRRMVV